MPTYNMFPSFLNGYQAGEQMAQKRRTSRALLGASQEYQKGNYDAIAPLLIANGDVDDAKDVSGLGYEQKSRDLGKKVGGKLAAGDAGGAAETAFNAGDLATGSAALNTAYSGQEHQLKMYTDRLQAGASLFGSLKTLPPEQRVQAAMARIKGTPLDTPEMEQKLQTQPLDDASLDSYVQGAMTAHEQATTKTAQTTADARMTTAQANVYKAHHPAANMGMGAGWNPSMDLLPDDPTAAPPAPAGPQATFTGAQ